VTRRGRDTAFPHELNRVRWDKAVVGARVGTDSRVIDTEGQMRMPQSRSLKHVKQYLESQMREDARQSREKGRRTAAPFVTLSRQAGAGGVKLGELVASLLNERKDETGPSSWTVFDENLVQAVMEEHQLPESVAKYMREEGPSEIQDILEGLFGLGPSTHRLVAKASRTMLRLASLGDAVVLPSSPRLGLAPAGLQVTGTFQPMKHRVQHAVRPLQLTLRKFLHPFDDGVSVALPFTEDGQYKGGG